MSKKLIFLISIIVLMLGLTGVVSADAISGVTATASTTEEGSATDAVDGSGLTGDLHDSGYLNMWKSDLWDTNGHDNPNPGTIEGMEWFKCDLGTTYSLGDLWVWNFSAAGGGTPGYVSRGCKNVTIEYSTSGGSDSSEWTKLGDYQFAIGTGSDGYAHNTEVAFSGVSARYVVITANDTAGNWGDPDGFHGLSELRFYESEGGPTAATNPSPSDSATDVDRNADLSWTAGNNLQDTNEHRVYVGSSFNDVNTATTASGEYKGEVDTASYEPGTMSANTTYYWRIDELNDPNIATGSVWSFTTQALPSKATSPSPANSATDVGLTADLSWTAGAGADDYDVYFGTVSPGASQGNQGGVTFDTGSMDANATYYWRIDPNNEAGTTTGDVWSFTTQALPEKATSPTPANSATDVGITTDLSWTAGAGADDYDVYFGTVSPGSSQGNQGGVTFDTGSMDANTTYYWRIDPNNETGATTGDVWSFTTQALPEKATSPTPANSANDVGVTTDLSWTAGAGTDDYDVYFGTVSPGSSQGNQGGTTFDTGLMANSTTYYWRIDPNNEVGTTTGDIWSFTTAAPESNDPIITDITGTAASTDEGSISKAVDGSGLNETGTQHNTNFLDMWKSASGGGGSGNPNPGTLSGATWVRAEFDQVYSLTELWVWNFNDDYLGGGSNYVKRGLKNVTIEYSTTGGTNSSEWSELGDYEFSIANYQDTYTGFEAADFNGVPAKYVVITANSTNGNWGDPEPFYGLSEFRFRGMIAYASNPSPADGTQGVDIDVVLSWVAGSQAASHDVYIGTDSTEVSNSTRASHSNVTLSEAQGSASYDPALSVDTTYYWRVDEVNDSNGPQWGGPVWSFYVSPSEAWGERPADDSNSLGRFLKWSAGQYAADVNAHRVYLGTSFSDVNSATTASSQYMGVQSGLLYSTADYNDGNGLDLEKAFYWRIDEVNGGSTYTGNVWSFNNRRRLIFNCDGDGVFSGVGGNLDQWISNIFDPLVDSHVDTLAWNDGSGGNTALYDSNVLEAWGTYTGTYHTDVNQWIEEGNDPPVVVVAQAHARGIEAWFSFRINDIHDAPEGSNTVGEYPTFKADNPSWMIGGGTDYGFSTALKFDIADVCTIKYDTIEEIFVKYDFDGIEIDFMRGPPFFQPDGNEWDQAHHLTSFLTDVRARLNVLGDQRGQKILIAARVDEDMAGCQLDGFDVSSWVTNDLIDIIILGSGVIDINVADFSAITSGTDVPIYSCIYGWPSEYNPIPENMAYALSTNYWYQGSDGVYVFNWYSHEGSDPYQAPLLDVIGNPDDLIGLDKFYAADRGYETQQRDYPHNWMNLAIPNDLSTGGVNTISFPLMVGEDINSVYEPNGISLVVECDGLDGGDTLVIKMNNTTLSQDRSGQTITTTPTTSDVIQGENQMYIEVTAGSVTINATELYVTYGDINDNNAPSPDPMTWASEPNAVDQNTITMTATTATDDSGVSYYFDCTTDSNFNSSWQDSTVYAPNTLDANTSYTFKVKARDKSPNSNETGWSDPCSAMTDAAPECGAAGQASNPDPYDTETGVDKKNQVFTWTAGSGTDSHDIYMSTDNPPAFVQNQSGTSYDPADQEKQTWYYWRIDEVNDCSGTTTGTVWSFETN